MEIEYIIVQAGGKGTRMEHLTRNKPKALVPVDNLPMLFHLFRKYPDKRFVIIGDYKYDVLRRYLHAFADVDYQLVCGTGHSGTCAGLQAALSLIPAKKAFMLIWSDLILPPSFDFPQEQGEYVGISKDFSCRWKFENGAFDEERSEEFGVAGLFLFRDKLLLDSVPTEGEFVRWLSLCDMKFIELPLYQTKEYGVISEYTRQAGTGKCRPFNRITIKENMVIKEPIDAQGEALAVRECAWYKRVKDKGFNQIPKIYSLKPLTMEKVDGKNVYLYNDLKFEEKNRILEQIIECLHNVQSLGEIVADQESYYDAYIGKTFKRLERVKELVPFANDETIVINGKKCRNVFFHKKKLEQMVNKYMPKKFCFIHGDCTFSNMILNHDGTPMLIDPRGYFGKTEFYGDSAYDWAKLYYSIVGNYDQFNLKRFYLDIRATDVCLKIQSSNWEDMEQTFFHLLEGEVEPTQIKLFHSIIWLSLTTYAWEDYDSICGAFYNGLLYLEDVL